MAIAGFNKVVGVKTTSSTAAYLNIPGTQATFNLSAGLLDDTDFTSTGWRSRIAGLKDFSITGTAIYDTSITAVNTLFTAYLNGTALKFQYLPNGTHGFAGEGLVESFNMTGDVGTLETFSFTLQSRKAGGLSTV